MHHLLLLFLTLLCSQVQPAPFRQCGGCDVEVHQEPVREIVICSPLAWEEASVFFVTVAMNPFHWDRAGELEFSVGVASDTRQLAARDCLCRRV